MTKHTSQPQPVEFLDYQPRPEALAPLSEVDFVAVVGPTAAGKSTLIDGVAARNPSVRIVIVTMSRAPRPGERDGIDSHFRSETEMRTRIARGEFVQVAPRVLGGIYATDPSDYATQGMAVMPVIVDALPTFKALPFKRFRQIFILPPSWDMWQRRLKTRDFTTEQITKRQAEAQTSLEYAATQPELDFIINDELDRAVSDLAQYITKDAAPISRIGGRKLAKQLLNRLKTNIN